MITGQSLERIYSRQAFSSISPLFQGLTVLADPVSNIFTTKLLGHSAVQFTPL